MIREICFFFRYGPAVQKRHKELGMVEFMKEMFQGMDADGYAGLRRSLVGDLEGDVLEIGAGTGALFSYYGSKAKVTATEPDDDFRAAAEQAAQEAEAEIKVLAGAGEELHFEDKTFDSVSASLVLCSVNSPSKTLAELLRVLRPGGQIRLLEHVRSQHWLAGPLMDLLNPIWFWINKVGCNWNRETVESVRDAGFIIRSIESHKIYSRAAPAVFPIRVVKAERPA